MEADRTEAVSQTLRGKFEKAAEGSVDQGQNRSLGAIPGGHGDPAVAQSSHGLCSAARHAVPNPFSNPLSPPPSKCFFHGRGCHTSFVFCGRGTWWL